MHAGVRFFSGRTHLAGVVAVGGGEVAEAGDGRGGDRGNGGHRLGAVGWSRAALSHTCSRIQAHGARVR